MLEPGTESAMQNRKPGISSQFDTARTDRMKWVTSTESTLGFLVYDTRVVFSSFPTCVVPSSGMKRQTTVERFKALHSRNSNFIDTAYLGGFQLILPWKVSRVVFHSSLRSSSSSARFNPGPFAWSACNFVLPKDLDQNISSV